MGETFIDRAIGIISDDYQKVDNVRIYMDNMLSYYVCINYEEKVFSISTSDVSEYKISEVRNLENNIDKSTNSNYSSGFITSPSEYESGYYDKSIVNVPTYSIRFFYMDDFAKAGNISRSNHCAPTAGINLAYYWYNRNNSKYASLMRTSWENSFVILHSLMKTTNSGGTYTKYLASAYQQYFYNYCGLVLSKCQLVSSPTIAQMKQEINEGYPFHICVYNHNVYKNHSMLALGYERYYYRNTGTEECYLRVADGWLPYPTRYVYITDSRISKDMIIVRPR